MRFFLFIVYGLLVGDIFKFVGGGAFLSSIFLVRAFIPQYVMSINAPLWFMMTVLQLYVCFPFFLMIKKKTGWIRLLSLTFAVNLLYQFFYLSIWGNAIVGEKLFLCFIFEYAVGMYLGNLYLINKKQLQQLLFGIKPLLVGIGFVGLGIGMGLAVPVFGTGMNDIFNAIGFFILFLNVVYWISQFKCLRFGVNFFGKYSLGLFLVHAPLILLFSDIFHISSKMSWFLLPVYIVLSLLCAMLFQKVNGKITSTS